MQNIAQKTPIIYFFWQRRSDLSIRRIGWFVSAFASSLFDRAAIGQFKLYATVQGVTFIIGAGADNIFVKTLVCHSILSVRFCCNGRQLKDNRVICWNIPLFFLARFYIAPSNLHFSKIRPGWLQKGILRSTICFLWHWYQLIGQKRLPLFYDD